ncbi:MAG: TIGR04190 family B12-binding domain/radical SAM domain protein [Anaerolineae bacterium]
MPKTDLILLHAPSVYDFRQEPILYGPISDMVPSTPVFELYPIGFTTIAEYLERYGFRVRIINLAVRMLKEPGFDVRKILRSLEPLAFGIDLHWLSHAHGAIEIARILKGYHPEIPVIFGGISASYFHEELITRPEVDYVMRGDSTEEPLRQLLECLRKGREPENVPNLTWRDARGQVHVNPLSYVPEDLNHLLFDYSYVVRAVARYRDLASFVPFKGWLSYPITAVLPYRGCQNNCKICGGSASAYRRFMGRNRPACRAPELLASDIRNIRRFSNGPVFILNDLRQPGMEYAERFLKEIEGLNRKVLLEFFDEVPRDFLKKISSALPNFVFEISPESHDEEVRRAFGRPYDNAALETTLENALEAGCERLDVFFMIGLPGQDYRSVMETIDYCGYLMHRFDRGENKRLFPFIAPLAPFLDPGSTVFEDPAAHGYRLFCRTFEEHRKALVQPSWKYILNYETKWLSREEIVASAYEAGMRLNKLKARYGLIPQSVAEETEKRIHLAIALSEKVDEIVAAGGGEDRRQMLLALKSSLDRANISTVCEKSELELPLGLFRLNLPGAAWFVLKESLSRKRYASDI